MKKSKDITKETRRAQIWDHIQKQHSVSRIELAEKFNISPNTLCVDLQHLIKIGLPLDMPPRSGMVYLNEEYNKDISKNHFIESFNQTNIRHWTLIQLLNFSSEPMSFNEICLHLSELTLDTFSPDTLRKDLVVLKNMGWIEMFRKKPDDTRTYCYQLTSQAPLLFEKHAKDLKQFCELYKLSGRSSSWDSSLEHIYLKASTLIHSDSAPLSFSIHHQTHGRLFHPDSETMQKLSQFQNFKYQHHLLKIPYLTNSGDETELLFALALIVFNHEKNQFYLLGEVDGLKTILRFSNITSIEKIEETNTINTIYNSRKYIRIFHEMFSLSLDDPFHVVVRFKKFGNMERKVRTLMKFRQQTHPKADFEYNETEILYEDMIRGIEDFARYLRSFGRAAIAVEPPELVERMKETPRRVMQAYERLGILNDSDKCI